VQVKKTEELQVNRPDIMCEDKILENVFKFKYLDSLFAADGSEDFDVNSRIVMAQQRCGQLRPLFDSDDLGPVLKVRLYVTAVLSLLTYGCETWLLTDKTIKDLTG